MPKMIAMGLAIAALTACTTSTPIRMPDGRAGYSIKCSGTANSWGSCMQEAGKLCGARGYNIFMRDSRGGFVATQTFAGSTIHREMIVACK